MPISATDLNKAYLAYFGRPADFTGKTYFATLEQADVIKAFDASAESKAMYGDSVAAKVNAIYMNLFNREAEPEGLTHWVAMVSQGRITAAGAAFEILNGAQGADATAVSNKLAASAAFIAAMDTTAEMVGYSGLDAAASARNWLKTVDSTAESLTAATAGAQAAVTAAVGEGTGEGGAGFQLTNSTDSASANVFTAGLVYTPGGDDRINSLQDEDRLTGTGVNPTLNATLGNANDNGATIITPKLNGVSTINVAFTGSGGTAVRDLDLQDATGVSAINITRITQATDTGRIENIKQVVTDLGLSNSNSNDAAGIAEFSFGTDVLLGNNTVDLDVNNVQITTVNIGQNTSGVGVSGVALQGYETINLNSTGSSNSIAFLNVPMDTGTAGKLVITGDKNLMLANEIRVINGATGTTESFRYTGGVQQANGRLSAIDASEFTGDLTLNIAAGQLTTGKADTSGVVQNVTITGGKGADKFILADTVQAGDSITGGDGTDTLVVTSGGIVNATSSVISKVETVEVRGTTGAAITVDFDKLPDATSILVRNEGAGGVVAPDAPAARAQVTALNNLTAAHAVVLKTQHSDTGSNGILQNTINATLKTAAGTADLVTLSIDEGLNTDPRFNLILGTQNATGATGGVESVTLVDNDTESNTVALASNGQHTGTVKLDKGLAGTFLNLDTTTAGANGGMYQYQTNGAADLTSSNAGPTVARIADHSLTAGQVKLGAATIDASTEASNVIVRVSSNAASVVGAQAITMGSGNDTVIFDNVPTAPVAADTRAGLTISDTVVGGAGSDTLVIDGHNTAITLGASEWTNVSGFETIRVVGNGTAANNAAGAVNSYNLTLTNSLLAANKDATTGFLAIVSDNDLFNDTGRTAAEAAAANVGGVLVANDAALNSGGVTIDGRTLAAGSKWSFNGNEGAGLSADRIILADANIDGNAVIDGGALDNITNNRGTNTTAGNATIANAGNADVIEVRNAGVVSQGDLANVRNIGTLSFTNDLAITQQSTLQLNDTIVDAMVDSYQASTSRTTAASATTGANVEVLVVNAVDNVNVAAATTGLVIEAGTLTDKSDLSVTLGRGANTVVTGAGQDRVVLLGNYVAGTYAVTENGVNINTQSTAAAAARVVTDTINLGTGVDALVTYGAINLAGATLTGIETITANSALVITTSQFNALVAARAALSLTGPVITFAGNQAHQLVIVDDTAGADTIDLSLVSVTGGSLAYSVGNLTQGAGAGLVTVNNAPVVSGTGTIALPNNALTTAPVNNTTPVAATAVTAGTTVNQTTAGENFIENGTGNSTVVITQATATGSYGAFEAGDTLKVNTTSNISTANAGAALGFSILDLTQAATAINLTLTPAQLAGLQTINAVGNDDSLTLTGVATLVSSGNLGAFSLVEGSNLTLGTSAADLAAVVTETGAVGTVSTVTLGNGVYTGVYGGIDATDVIRVGTTTNVSANTGLNTGAVIDFQNAASVGAGLTLNATQNGVVTFANTTGNQTITLTAADVFTTATGIEVYNLFGAANTVTLGASAVTVNDSGNFNDTVNTGTLTSLTGYTLNLATGTDVLTVTTTGTDLSGLNTGLTTTAETLTIDNIANVSLTQAQFDFATVNAAGTNNLTFTNAVAGLALGAATTNALETVTLGNAGNDTVTVTTGAVATFGNTVSLAGGGSDTVTITNTAIASGDAVAVTITGFNAAGNDKVISLGAPSSFQTVTAAGTATTVSANGVIEIETGVGELLTPANGDGLAAEVLISAALAASNGTLANGNDLTVVMYGGGNAYIYQVDVTAATADVVAADIDVELVGTLTGVTANSLTSANFV